MNQVLIIVLVWIVLNFITPHSFAQTSTESGEVKNTEETKGVLEKVAEPSPGFPSWIKCGFCAESHPIETKILKSPSPSPSGADVKGVQVTPKPSVKATIKPTLKPVISPSPLSSPSASVSASPSPQPTLAPAKQKQLSNFEKIWGWVLKLFTREN